VIDHVVMIEKNSRKILLTVVKSRGFGFVSMNHESEV